MAAKVYSREMRRLACGDAVIEYELTRKAVKNINLRIDAAGTVKVSANRRVPVSYIESFIKEKQDFIMAAVERAGVRAAQEKAAGAAPRRYAEGEALRLLGRPIEVRVVKCPEESVRMEEGCLFFYVKNPDDTHHKELLYEKWVKTYQREVFEKVCRQVHEKFMPLGVDYPEIKMRRMRARWGSCQPYRGIVTLNSRLIETPLPCIEYVAVHEFSHFIHPNHSKEFHALMTRMMPDWKQRKKLLNTITEWN